MKTITIDGQDITCPDIKWVGDAMVLEITEGEFSGVQFTVSDMIMGTDTDLHYTLHVSEGTSVDQIKPIVDNYLIQLMWDHFEKQK